MKRIHIIFALCTYVFCICSIWGQSDCISINTSTVTDNPTGISFYNCIETTGYMASMVGNGTQNYDIVSGSVIKINGGTTIRPQANLATRVYIDQTPIIVNRLVPTSGGVPRYEKLEFGIILPPLAEERISNFVNETPNTVQLNPFDPLDVDIRAEFQWKSQSGWQTKGYQYGFYYREYELDTAGASLSWHRDEISVPERFRLRYAPPLVGEWRVRFTVFLKNIATYNTAYYHFNAVESDNPGYMKVSADDRYFELGDDMYIPVGQNQSNPFCVSEYCDDMGFENFDPTNPWTPASQYSPEGQVGQGMPGTSFAYVKSYRMYQKVLEAMKAGGANYFRLLTSESVFDVEFEKLGNYHNRMELAWEMDRVLDVARELDLRMTLNLAGHTRIEDASIYYSREWDWGPDPCLSNQYCYNDIPGVDTPVDFITNATAKRYFKNRLRYMVARYGYSTNIGIMELMSEVNNIGKGVQLQYMQDQYGSWCAGVADIRPSYNTDSTVVPYLVFLWQNEMLGYIKDTLLHTEHLTGVSYAGNSCDIPHNDYSYFSPYVDYVGFNNGDYVLNRFRFYSEESPSYVSTYRNTYGIQKPLVNSETIVYPFSACDNFSEWYKNIWIPPFCGPALVMNWEYQFHKTFPQHITLFGNLVGFLQGSDFRNHNGYTWTPRYATREDNMVDMFYMRGEKNNDRWAEGVVLNKTYNFYTQKNYNGNDACNTITLANLDTLGYSSQHRSPVNLNYDNNDKLKINGMGNGKWYYIDWYDPVTGDWFYTDFQISNVVEGYLTIQFPTLTASIQGWQNWSLFDGIRPLLAFKVRPYAENRSRSASMENMEAWREERATERMALENQEGSVREFPKPYISVYPNPAGNFVHVEVSDKYERAVWKLHSAEGKLIGSGILYSGTNTIGLDGLGSGMYWLHIIYNDGETSFFKVIKQ